MLVLSGKVGESFFIAEGTIKVQVIEVRGKLVRLGFQAPRDVKIDREKIYQAKKTEGDKS